jgi:flagellar transcriptional activator FlhD
MTTSNAGPLAEIREVNLSYLLLAQRLILEDRPAALARLAISEAIADIIAALTPETAVKVAATSHVLCRFGFDDHALLSSLAEKVKESGAGERAADVVTLPVSPAAARSMG